MDVDGVVKAVYVAGSGRAVNRVVTPHSVVTAHLVDEDGHPTVRARDEILGFLAERLGVGS
ncbi:hypothetical protein GCM10010289_03060 [Streptomyces violascens]|nr:hypothetical protein GCM10010289_03060 [Streptomyces violascens]